MVSNLKMSVCCASKWAVIGWSDSLRLEMERLTKNVKITTATPYYINTDDMYDSVKSERAANKIVNAIEKDKIFIRIPGLVYLLPFVKGTLPVRWFGFIIGKGFGVYKTINEFIGYKNILEKNDNYRITRKTA